MRAKPDHSGTRRALFQCLLSLLSLGTAALPAQAFELPAICSEQQFASALAASDAQAARTKSLPELRVRVEKLIETDPNASVALMCATIPRVEKEKGDNSADMAWWVGSLATPMIAFMDRMAEAVPLLDFARPILERRLGPYAAEVAEIHVAHAWIATRQGRTADAAVAWRNALRIRERNPGPRKLELQKILVGLAQTLSQLREFGEARNALSRAQQILVENGETISEAAAAIENTFINIAWREEDYAGARAHAEAQIRIEEQMASPAAQRVPAYVWLGQSLERLDEYGAAEAALRKAVEIAESKAGAPLQRHHFTALAQLSGLLIVRGKPAEALTYAKQSIAIGEATRGPDAPMLVRPLQYLGDAQSALGDLPEALRTYERAAAIVAKYPNDVERPWIVAHHRGIARLHLKLGDREQALASLKAALQAAGEDETLTVERASTLLTLGTLSGFDATGSGHEALDRALALYRTRLPDSHPAIFRTITESCWVEMARDSSRVTSCDEVMRRLERGTHVDPFLRHDAYAVRSELSARRGEPQQAYDLAIRALAAASVLGTPDPLWRADFLLARLMRERNERALAIFLGKQSIGEIERLRGRFVGEDRRLEQGFLDDKVRVYRSVADWLMEEGRIDEGLDVLRLLKAEEIYDFVLRDSQWERSSAGIELSPAELDLRDRFAAIVGEGAPAGNEIDRLGRLQEIGRISAEERQALESLLTNQQQIEAERAQRIREFLAGGVTPSVQRPERRQIEAERLSRDLASMGKDTALAFYLLTDTRLRVLIATRRGQFEYESAVDAVALRRDIGRLLEAIGRREDVEELTRALYESVAKPLDVEARRAGAKRLVLWLDGPLRYLPFSALHDGKQFLIDRYAVENYVPEVVALEDPVSQAAAASRPVADRALHVRGLGLTRSVGGYDALPAMADELCDVVRGPIEGLQAQGRTCPRAQLGAGALEGLGFADAAFTPARLQSLMSAEKDFSVLHLGTHFSLRPGNARKSYLVLGDGSRLTLDAIGALNFSGLQLVTLSACQSGLGGARTDDGREVEGLSAIVQRRGAQHVVASLWRVEDRSTALLMREMYRTLAERKTEVAPALRRSQLRLRAQRDGAGRRPYEHPYFWAGFIVTGSRE